MLRRTLLLVLAGLALSCGGAPAPAAPAAAPEKWTARLDVDHPLVGRIWDVAQRRFVTRDDFDTRIAAADYVLLGEKHDNPDHHRLQARALRAMIARGRAPAVAFEMIETDAQHAVDAFLEGNPTSAAGLGAAVKWDDRGWPTWGDYEPIAQAALDAHLPIVAANLPHAKVRAVVMQQADVDASILPHGRRSLPVLPPELGPSLMDELRASHCGHLPEEMLPGMMLAQVARDVTMASAMERAGGKDKRGAVLIAGAGHARKDRGVPFFLRTEMPAEGMVTVAFVEVDHGATKPAAYAPHFFTGDLPFDFVWFTPRLDDADPCEKFRHPKKEAP